MMMRGDEYVDDVDKTQWLYFTLMDSQFYTYHSTVALYSVFWGELRTRSEDLKPKWSHVGILRRLVSST